jgi:hypothetical protein
MKSIDVFADPSSSTQRIGIDADIFFYDVQALSKHMTVLTSRGTRLAGSGFDATGALTVDGLKQQAPERALSVRLPNRNSTLHKSG